MKGLIVEILKIVAPLSVGLIVFAQGLSIAPIQVLAYLRERPWLIVRSAVAALVLVPAAALALILLLRPAPGVAVGLAILVSCPPAPLMLNVAPKKAGASGAFMAALHLSLAALAFVTVPAVLYVLSIPLGFDADVNIGVMAWVVGRTILVPVGLGLAIRGAAPALADRLAPGLGRTGSWGLIVVLLFVMVALYPALLSMDSWSYVVIASVSVAALAIGHAFGPQDMHEKASLAIECGVRHPALAITIASANFSPAKAMPVLVPCVITFSALAMVYMLWRGRSLAGQQPAGVTR